MDKVITYNFNENFIDKLAAFLVDNFSNSKNDFSKVGIVFGGKRPALFLKRQLALKTNSSYFSPQFFSIDEFVDFIVTKSVDFSKINEMDSCFILYNLAKRHIPELIKKRQSFSEFLPWARELSGFIEQLDLEDINPEQLRHIEKSADIGYEVPEKINSLLGNIVLLRQEFHRIIDENRSYTRGLLYLKASAIVQKQVFEEFDKILFCGFFYLTNTEKQIIRWLLEKDKAVLFFQKDSKDWSVFKDNERVFNAKIEPGPADPLNYNLNIHAGFDTHSQVCIAREILKEIKEIQNSLIVLPDADTIVPLLSEITSVVDEFNVSIGYPLKRSSLYSLFELVFKAQADRKQDDYYTKDYLKALRHPLIKNMKFSNNDSTVTRVIIHKTEELLTGMEENPLAGSLFVSLEDIEDLKDLYEASNKTLKSMGIEIKAGELKDILKQIHGLLFYCWENLRDFEGFSDVLEDFLDTLLKKSPLDNYPINLLIADRIFQLNRQFKRAGFHKESFPKDEIFEIFIQDLDNQTISFSGSPLKGLQVLGILETRGLNFDNVIVLDANEQVLPRLNIYEPLIPREVMLGLKLNRLEKEDEIQRYQFMRLLGAAKNVHLIYDGSIEKEKSRFIEEIVWERQKSQNKLDVASVVKAAFSLKIQPPKQEFKKTREMVGFLKERQYSASSINTYLNCPLKFYYQYVLGLKEKEDLLDEPEAADIGNFAHEFLEEMFGPFKNRKPVIDPNFEKHFMSVLEERFDEVFKRKMKSDSFLLREIFMIRMRYFLESEKKRGVSKIICLEKDQTAQIVLPSGTYSFKYRVDRIDRLSDKSFLVIDYKTGSTDLKPVSLNKIEEKGFKRQVMKNTIKSFQLPLYYYFASEQLKSERINAAFYNLKNSTLISLLKPDEVFQQKKVIDIFMKGLDAIFRELLDENVSFSADDDNANFCSNCQFFYLCR
jgi:CRISPR/Cas system-associated exonuclease Cas4 (RecB family)